MESIESLASAVREYRDLTNDTANKAAEALWLLGLIERQGWLVAPQEDLGPDAGKGPWEIETSTCIHRAPTLPEALTEAANCDRCTGKQET